MWQKLQLELMSLKIEQRITKMHNDVVAALSEVKAGMRGISDDLQAVKMRQDLVQDMIQSTLAGEIPTGHSCYRSGSRSFRPPSAGPSAVALSLPIPSAQIQQRQPQTAFSQPTYLPSYSTPVNSTIDHSIAISRYSIITTTSNSTWIPLPYSDGTPLPTHPPIVTTPTYIHTFSTPLPISQPHSDRILLSDFSPLSPE